MHMQIADKRISAAQILIKRINAELNNSFAAFLICNSYEILLFFRENIMKFYTAVKLKRNFDSVFSVGIIARRAVIKPVNRK